MRLVALYATSIIAGFCMMALEIMGGRVLQPIFGSSIDVWAAVISVFILSLSIGYVIGGRIADHAKTNAPLGWMILAAGACYCLLGAVSFRFMDSLGEKVHISRWGVLFAAAVLFLVPSMLLGAVSPTLVRLVFVSAERVGRTTGTLYAVGSIGNVLGVLVSDYVLLQRFNLNTNLYVMGLVLGVLGILHLLVPVSATVKVPGASPAAEPSGEAREEVA
ncbi:MAG: fused MFS/spermidine synthase [Byssovorax sp.]